MADIENMGRRVGALLALDNEAYTIAITNIAAAAVTAVSMPGGSRVAMEELCREIDQIIEGYQQEKLPGSGLKIADAFKP